MWYERVDWREKLEAGAFLADAEFQLMTAAERGLYCTMVLYLYCNGGRWKPDKKRMKKLCNRRHGRFEESFQEVPGKLAVRRGLVHHKRVTAELRKTQVRRLSAVKAAQSRWWGQSGRNAVASAAQCQGKGIEGKRSNISSTNTKEHSCSVSSSIRVRFEFVRWILEKSWRV